MVGVFFIKILNFLLIENNKILFFILLGILAYNYFSFLPTNVVA